MKNVNTAVIIILAAIGLTISGLIISCRHLNPEGVYHGDIFLWSADTIIVNSYFTVDEFLKFELNNREALKGTPGIKQFADKLREEFPKLHKEAMSLRDIYAQVSTQENRDKLTRALDSIHQSVLEISKYQTPSMLIQK